MSEVVGKPWRNDHTDRLLALTDAEGTGLSFLQFHAVAALGERLFCGSYAEEAIREKDTLETADFELLADVVVSPGLAPLLTAIHRS